MGLVIFSVIIPNIVMYLIDVFVDDGSHIQWWDTV